tara:strand:- start:438 stop:1718 length:1281 start_codon:yes stop_codon:yes gene_type:complete
MIKKKINFKYIILFFFIFTLNFQSDAFSSISKEKFTNQIAFIERNYKEYEITKASNLIDLNENLIQNLALELDEIELDVKIAFYQEVSEQLNEIKANTLLKVIEKDAKNNKSIKELNSIQFTKITEVFEQTIPNIYTDNRSINDSPYLLASIINEADIRLSNEIVKKISNTSKENNHSNSLASNVVYYASEINSNFLLDIDREQKNTLIIQSVNELSNELKNDKFKIKKKLNNNFAQDSLFAVSSAILKSKNEISSDIIAAIENTSSNEKKKIGFKLTQQTAELNEWREEKNINLIKNRNVFAEKIFPIGFSNIDQDKKDVADKLIQNTDPKTSEILIKSIINTHIAENNNFLKLDNKTLNSLEDMFNTAKVNNSQIIKSRFEAEAIFDILFDDTLDPNLLKNPQFQLSFALIPKKKFNLNNVSPN